MICGVYTFEIVLMSLIFDPHLSRVAYLDYFYFIKNITFFRLTNFFKNTLLAWFTRKLFGMIAAIFNA